MKELNGVTQFDGENAFLSNFWPCKIVLWERAYPSVEHAYQAAKCIDDDEREEIRLAATPGKAKRLGRKCTIRSNWERVKARVMEQLVRAKFKDPELMAKLRATGTQEIIEGNTWNDRFWGMVWDEKANQWRGQNQLGRILMMIRDEATE